MLQTESTWSKQTQCYGERKKSLRVMQLPLCILAKKNFLPTRNVCASVSVLQLVPDLEEAVPAPRGDGQTVLSDPETADAVVVACQNTDAVATQGIPNVTIEIVVAGKQQPTALGECNRGDSANDVVVSVQVQFLEG